MNRRIRETEKDHRNIEEKMPSCDEYGLIFESISDLARHINRWCPENNDLRRKREDDEDDYKEDQTIINEGEDIAFTKLAELARETNEGKWESKVDKYVNDGLTKEEARMKANRKLNGVHLDQLMSSYGTLIQYVLQLKNGKLHVHSKVMKVVDKLLDDGMDCKKAVKVAIRKYKHMLENYLDEVIDN